MTTIQSLLDLTSRELSASDAPLANSIQRNVPVYDCKAHASALDDPIKGGALMAELAGLLLNGAGAFVLKGAYQDFAIVDAASDAFLEIIAEEKATKISGADHFAAAGANDRIWNSLEKLCFKAPEVYCRYHANRWIDFASRAWLGPAYQVTAQVNLVRPGGKAQEAHCDYHLGFMTQEQVNAYPAHVHGLSHQLTLQGAVAHCDMPVESGTTKLLPFSQMWSENYARFRDPQVREHFEENCIQLPLEKGDLLFFSPGLLHGAGDNVTKDVQRMANLLQVSSAFGIPLEQIGRTRMCKQIYLHLAGGEVSKSDQDVVIASTAHGYPFSTNLDLDPPVGGLAPQSQQALMRQALDEGWSSAKFNEELDVRERKRLSN